MDIVITDTARKPLCQLGDYTLDLAYGYGEDADDGENSFTLAYPMSIPYRMGNGSIWYADGSEYGGIVDTVSASSVNGVAVVEYSGRSWSGILRNKVLAPDTGKDYLHVDGDAGAILQQLVQRIGLGSLFAAHAASGIHVTADFRYEDAYTGIRTMLQASGAKLRFGYESGKVTLTALPVQTYNDTVDSDLMDFTSDREYRPVNHLIGLGTGKLKDRKRSDWYADANGNVSQKQTFTGVDEVCQVYDYSNANAAELAKETQKKLKELQTRGQVDVTVHANHVFDIGDVITASNREVNLTVTATVCKKIVTASNGVFQCDYEVGQKAGKTGGLSGGGESDVSEGHAYYAGKGLTLDAYTFNADVTQDKLDAVAKTADEANATASGISADVGKANETAQNALTTAQNRVGVINATRPLTVVRSGDTVTVGATDATQTASGLLSAKDKKKLDGLENYALPPATTTMLGGVRPDGQTITITADGVITAHTAGGGGGGITWPVGSIYQNTTGANPANDFGGEWVQRPSLGPYTWEKTGNGTVTPPVAHSALGVGALGTMILGGES